MRRLLFGLVVVALGVACDNQSSTSPSTSALSLSGTWSTNLSVSGETALMVWTLTQTSSTNVSGPVLVALPSGTVLLNGSLTGTLTGSTLVYTIAVAAGGIPASPSCTGQLGGTMTAVVAATSTLTGNVSVNSTTCTPPFAGGTFTLTEQ